MLFCWMSAVKHRKNLETNKKWKHVTYAGILIHAIVADTGRYSHNRCSGA